jgi:hypothetical protein
MLISCLVGLAEGEHEGAFAGSLSIDCDFAVALPDGAAHAG